jgi:ribosomal-protein-alanine N-acetyltransferase
MSQTTLRLRAMRPDDLPAVMAIEDRVFVGDAWPESVYRRDLDNPDALYCVLDLAVQDNRSPAIIHPSYPAPIPLHQFSNSPIYPSARCPLLGYAGCWFIEDEAHLMTIAIAPEWHGRGLGEWLLLGVLDLVEARGAAVCTLEVRVSNAEAQALYRKLGFEVAGQRRRYYQDNGEDALIMTTPPLYTPAMQALRQQRRYTAGERLAERLQR